MSDPSSSLGGRAASQARRAALSAGKAALPPATERSGAAGRRGPALAPPPPSPAPVASAPAMTAPREAGPVLSGKQASLERRRQLSAGKAALAGKPAAIAAPAPVAAAPASPVPATPCVTASCRDQARARRAMLSARGRGDAPPAASAQAQRVGALDYAPKVLPSPTQGGAQVTGPRMGQGRQVTGDERGGAMPVSGTQYIEADSGGWRPGGPKVGHARTEGGLVVSGTMVRGKSRITGDEAGAGVAITGEADPRIEDDLTLRPEGGAAPLAQFQRQANPHGAATFAANLGRSARIAGSRERSRAPALEATQSGLAITGSALGRSVRVTGDESGACRTLTGSQYLAPARLQPACGGPAPAAGERADAVTRAKVSVSRTWGGQRVTGPNVEHQPRVSGDMPGSCAPLTGSQYQGPDTLEGWCDPADAARAGARRIRSAGAPVTGDAPVQSRSVSGAARGAERDITGTPYHRAERPSEAPADPVAALDGAFSVVSPQRVAHLRQQREAGRITGAFAVGEGKVTGNFDFLPRPRQGGGKTAPHAALTGEGSVSGSAITGDAWSETRRVTGVEGAFAAERNPTRGGEPAKAFAGSATFKGKAAHEEPKQLVTGMFGYFSKSGARVTLSGGAQS